MDSFAKIVNDIYVLTIAGKSSILDVCGGSWLRLCSGYKVLKQPSRGVLREKCSENIYRTPIPKCDFDKVANQITFWHGCSPVNLLHISKTPFDNIYGGRGAASESSNPPLNIQQHKDKEISRCFSYL